MTTLFVSDLHLSARRPETADLFLRFLAGPARDASALYILGDLFDYWAGDDAIDDPVDPFNRRICDALAALAIPKFFLPGNRDFLAGEQFGESSGLTFVAEPSVIDISGTPTLLLHGDTLCTDDVDYQAVRKVLRSAAWRRDILPCRSPSASARSRDCANRARRPRAARATTSWTPMPVPSPPPSATMGSPA